MAQHILRCPSCNKYTLQEQCSACSIKTKLVKPPKFSLNDKYAEYRRRQRKVEQEEKKAIKL